MFKELLFITLIGFNLYMISQTNGYDPVQNYANSTAKIINGSADVIEHSSDQVVNSLDRLTAWIKSITPKD